MVRNNWTREHLIVAFDLYCRIPFGKIDHRNPAVRELAELVGRTPSAVAWKLSNFASLDPELKKRNIRGASHGSKGDQQIWDEFNADWNKLSFESGVARFNLGRSRATVAEQRPPGKDALRLTKTRVNQGFFRAAVLAAYNGRCCVTGIDNPELLCASHIIPWNADSQHRTDPSNGLCLNALHDRAFDRGLLTITEERRVLISRVLKVTNISIGIKRVLVEYDGQQVKDPDRFAPKAGFLRYHNQNVFRG